MNKTVKRTSRHTRVRFLPPLLPRQRARCYLRRSHRDGQARRMSGDEHPSTTASHWRDTNPPLFTKERLETSSGTSTSFDTATLLAVFVFVGVVVLAHYRPGSARMHALSPSRPVSGVLRGTSAVESATNLLCGAERPTRAARQRGPAAPMAACQCLDDKASGPQANGKGRLMF